LSTRRSELQGDFPPVLNRAFHDSPKDEQQRRAASPVSKHQLGNGWFISELVFKEVQTLPDQKFSFTEYG
jgi:hypothetical protein